MPAGNGDVFEAARDIAPPLQVSNPNLSVLAEISIPRSIPVKNLCIVSILARWPREVNYFWGTCEDLLTGKKKRGKKARSVTALQGKWPW
jgi:hypothetical protein